MPESWLGFLLEEGVTHSNLWKHEVIIIFILDFNSLLSIFARFCLESLFTRDYSHRIWDFAVSRFTLQVPFALGTDWLDMALLRLCDDGKLAKLFLPEDTFKIRCRSGLISIQGKKLRFNHNFVTFLHFLFSNLFKLLLLRWLLEFIPRSFEESVEVGYHNSCSNQVGKDFGKQVVSWLTQDNSTECKWDVPKTHESTFVKKLKSIKLHHNVRFRLNDVDNVEGLDEREDEDLVEVAMLLKIWPWTVWTERDVDEYYVKATHAEYGIVQHGQLRTCLHAIKQRGEALSDLWFFESVLVLEQKVHLRHWVHKKEYENQSAPNRHSFLRQCGEGERRNEETKCCVG